jgi:uncharacterized cupredoxin-like copper-binding protein
MTQVRTPSSESSSPIGGGRDGPPATSNREVWKVSTTVFSLLAFLMAFCAVVTAGQAWSRSNDARSDIAKLAAGGLLAHQTTVVLEEYSMTPRPAQVKAGPVKFTVHNNGSITHEFVLVRAASPEALPRVTTATAERAVGDVDEDAIPEADKLGETGDIRAGKTAVKTFTLSAGTYVMFCNIDNAGTNGVLNHFSHGMSATITAS